MNRLTVVGRGTVGCMAIAHFLRWTDWEIIWAYDPTIAPVAVGEGTTFAVPRSLKDSMKFRYTDMEAIDSTVKLGVRKHNWGSNGTLFDHSFGIGDVGLHFNAVNLQNYIFEKLKNHPRITLLEKSVRPDEVDSDYVMMCTGTPTEFTDYDTIKHIPINACYVSQCPWELARFNYTLAIARPYGWVFGIPLNNRCSIGYMYNSDINTLDEIKADSEIVLKEYGLTPALQREIKFSNYFRKNNFSDRVVYNGNSSFFLEPLEATSTALSDQITRFCIDIWKDKTLNPIDANRKYNIMIDEIESMISMHYMAGSIYQTKFWDHAMNLGEEKIKEQFNNNTPFSQIIRAALSSTSMFDLYPIEIGTWGLLSYKTNIDGLGIRDRLKNLKN